MTYHLACHVPAFTGEGKRLGEISALYGGGGGIVKRLIRRDVLKIGATFRSMYVRGRIGNESSEMNGRVEITGA